MSRKGVRFVCTAAAFIIACIPLFAAQEPMEVDRQDIATGDLRPLPRTSIAKSPNAIDLEVFRAVSAKEASTRGLQVGDQVETIAINEILSKSAMFAIAFDNSFPESFEQRPNVSYVAGDAGACCTAQMGIGSCVGANNEGQCDAACGHFHVGQSCASTDCTLSCDADCDWCWTGTACESACDPAWEGDGECDCGCQFDDVASGDCPAPECGNGIIEGNEECDDGNTSSGDGCAADCQHEPCIGCPQYSVHQMIGDPADPSGDTLCYRLSDTSFPGAPDDIVDFDGVAEVLTTDFLGTVAVVIESESSNPDGTFNVSISSSSPLGTDLFPGGYSIEGRPLTSACWFIGVDDLLDWNDSQIVTSAMFSFTQDGDVIAGPFDLCDLGFPICDATGWNGFLGVVLGGAAGAGFNDVHLDLIVRKGEACGNGVLDPGEVCDDSNTDDCDGCRGDCSEIETGCGDGFRCGDEECDGPDDDACPGECTLECACVSCNLVPLLESKYDCDASLSRFGNNVLRLTFESELKTAPVHGEIEIHELLEGGLFGPDISAQFVFSIEDGNVLKIVEPGQVFTNESWYAVMNTGGWCDAEDFEVDYAVVYGDANNDHVTGFTDLSAINASMSDPIDTEDNNRFDINTDGQVSFTDLSAANEFNGSIALIDNKPTGHGCSP